METNKVFAALLENPDISARQLVGLAKVKPNTVTTVIQRYRQALSERRAPSDGKKGQPELFYTVKPEWVDVLREKLALDSAVEQVSAVEQALRTLEAASFAAIDPVLEPGERDRMKDSAELRAKAARSLVEDEEDETVRLTALERIAVAEKRYGASIAAAERTEENNIDAMLVLLKRWRDRAAHLGTQYGGEIVDGSVRRDSVALVLDLLAPANSAPQVALLDDALRHYEKAAIRVPLMALSEKKREQFLKDFEVLALDPAASLVKLVVMVDSEQRASKDVWAKINRLCDSGRKERAMEIGLKAMHDAMAFPEVPAREVRPIMQFMTGCVQRVVEFADHKRSFWGAYGEPQVVDVNVDAKFKAKAKENAWAYNRATKTSLPKVIAAHIDVQEA